MTRLMKRLVVLGVGLGVLPVATGCVEDVRAEDPGKKPAAGSKADPPPAEGPAVGLPALPATDPLLTEAVQARDQIARLEEELLARLDDLRTVLTSARSDPDRLRESAEQFLELTADVRRKTAQAKDALQAVEEKAGELSRSSRHLSASYRALAGLYRRKARDYGEPKLRDQLLGFAEDYDAVAAALPARCRAVDAVRKKLPALKRKVAEVTAFLDDAAAFLASHPAVGGGPGARYAGEFRSFAVTVSEWLRTLDELRAALRAGAVSKAIQASVRAEVAERARLDRAERATAEASKRAELARLAALANAEQTRDQDRPTPAAPPTVVREPGLPADPAATPVSAPAAPTYPSAPWPVAYRYQPAPATRRCP
ncbi:MAG: hypothetical protein U0871_00915 [Gemmataceae bacterium]